MTAMRLILEVGLEAISRELLRKRAWLVPALQAKGYAVAQAEAPPDTGSGIVSLSQRGNDLSALHRKLTAASVFTSLRVDRAGQQYLRLSPHFYNTDAELQRVMEML